MSHLYEDRANLNKELLVQVKKVKSFFITFSEMNSTINEKDTIEYSEIIIKIPVIVYGKNYLFPIITFVTNKYSLIRGFYWGFNKDDKVLIENKGDSFAVFKEKVVNLNIPTIKNYKNRIDTPNILQADMILFGTSEMMQSPDILVTLDVQNYRLKESASFKIKEINLGTLLENNVTASEIYFTEDEFQLGKVKKIDNN